MRKGEIAATVLIALMGVMLPWTGARAETTEAVTYDAAEFEAFAGRTEEETAQKYIEARYAAQEYEDSDPASFYEKQPSLEAPYHPGLLSRGTLKTMLSMCNFYRYLVGNEEAGGLTIQSDLAGLWDTYQRQAYLWNFASESKKPEEFPEEQWGKPATSYYEFSVGMSPLEGIKNCINATTSSMDRNTIYTYSGRKDILSPYTARINMGFSGVYFVEQSPTDYSRQNTMPFYSFPSEGYMPNDLLAVNKVAWNVIINRNCITIPTEGDITVIVTQRESGEKFIRSTAEGNAYANDVNIFFAGPAGENMTAYEGIYDVEVCGLSDAATGREAKICYTVHFFDPEGWLDTAVKEVSVDGITKFVLPKELATADNIKKLTAILPSKVTVTGESGRKIILPVENDWVYDVAGSCWKNSVDEKKLPSGFRDPSGLLSDVSISCETGNNRGLTFEMFWHTSFEDLIPGCPTDGRGGKITIKWGETSKIDHAVLYQITKKEQGYTAAIWYDWDEIEKKNGSETEHAFVFPTAYFIKDSGDYAAVGYVDGEKTAYVSDTITTLLVTERKTYDDPKGNTGGANTGGGTDGGNVGGGTGGGTNSAGNGTTETSKGSNDIAANPSEKSSTEKVKKKKNSVPAVAKVKKFKAAAKKKGFVLTWKKVSKASGYQIQISTNKKFKKARKYSINKKKAKYKISRLKTGKKYYLRIRAYKTYKTQDGKTKKAYGKWVVKKNKL